MFYLGIRFEKLAGREEPVGSGEDDRALGGGREAVDGGIEPLVLLEDHVYVLEEDECGLVQV